MTDERSASAPDPAAGPAPMPDLASSTTEVPIDVVEEQVRALEKEAIEAEAKGAASAAAAAAAKSDRPSRPPRDSSAQGRRRTRGLRIPDDDVARPQSPPRPSVPDDRAADGAEAGAVVVPTRIITINPPERATDAPPATLPTNDVRAPMPSEELIPIDLDAPASAPESIEPMESEDLAARAAPPPRPAPRSRVPTKPDIPLVMRREPIDIEPADLVLVEPVQPAPPPPPPRARMSSQPPPTSRPAFKPPLVVVPPHDGNLSPPQPESSGFRRKAKLWWEDLFNDEYVRTMSRSPGDLIAREVDFIEDSLGVEKNGAVLDLACGIGRHAIELARRGYEVVGCDLSLAMLARAGDEAQSRGAKLDFVQGDMRELTFDERFDGVYCWNTSFGYFEEDKNIQVVERVRRALKTGGQFLLDVANRDFLIRQSPSLAWFEGDGCVCMDEMSVDFITSRMRVKRTIMFDDGRSREIEYSMRVYSLHELGKILHDTGFKVSEVTGRTATPGVFFGSESPRTIVLAEKR